jgi:hypothetical protein
MRYQAPSVTEIGNVHELTFASCYTKTIESAADSIFGDNRGRYVSGPTAC